MLIQSDDTLFHHQYHNDPEGEVLKRKVQEAIDASRATSTDVLAFLNAEIAHIAGDINRQLIPRNLKDFRKQVALADYLAKQKVIVPLPLGYLMRASTGPITQWSVDNALRNWGFEPTQIRSTIKKGKHFRSGECYVKVIFERK